MTARKRGVWACALVAAAVLVGGGDVFADDEPCAGFDNLLTIDVKPCKDPNVLNVNVPGWLPVCLELNEGTVVTEVMLEDVLATTVFWSEEQQCVLAKFDVQDVVLALGSVDHGEDLVVELTCRIEDLSGAVASWCGWDTVKILERGNRH